MNENNYVIVLKDISKIYKTGDEKTIALNNINLEIKHGEFVAIMGASGSGKSSLMHILGLLDTPSDGVYLLDGKEVAKIHKSKQAEIRNRKIGFVFQQFNLLPRTTVLDNVMLPTIYGNKKIANKDALKVINDVGLSDRVNHKSNELSGGQIQRVAIARALIMNPSLVLADEPTGNLDSKKTKEILNILQSINKNGATVVLITHEEEVAKYARRIIKLKDGKIVTDTINSKETK